MTEKLTCIERELRRAVESQQYAEVQRLVLSFCELAEAHARTLPPGDPGLGEIAGMTQELLQWTRCMVKTSRESLSLQLRQIPRVKRYIPAPAAAPALMRVDA
jgi:hypothetical protein